ncbi:hypothetical protein ACIP9G_21810, partial [Lysinibacillus sp. NPDC093197]|uniref:hypothetical protein n=1 Tax=Lysinibacillus sp. NPDC093197 TaxID=3364132 RepID=UPI00381E2240
VASNFSSAVNFPIEKLHLQLLDVSNNWGAVQNEGVILAANDRYVPKDTLGAFFIPQSGQIVEECKLRLIVGNSTISEEKIDKELYDVTYLFICRVLLFLSKKIGLLSTRLPIIIMRGLFF